MKITQRKMHPKRKKEQIKIAKLSLLLPLQEKKIEKIMSKLCAQLRIEHLINEQQCKQYKNSSDSYTLHYSMLSPRE